MNEDKNLDGVGGGGRPSRHRPPGSTATAEAAQGARRRAHAPGPPGDVHTARPATDTWPGKDPTSVSTPVSAPAGGDSPQTPDGSGGSG